MNTSPNQTFAIKSWKEFGVYLVLGLLSSALCFSLLETGLACFLTAVLAIGLLLLGGPRYVTITRNRLDFERPLVRRRRRLPFEKISSVSVSRNFKAAMDLLDIYVDDVLVESIPVHPDTEALRSALGISFVQHLVEVDARAMPSLGITRD